MSWIDKILPSGVRKEEGERRSSVPEGLWKKCVKCDAVLYRPDVERNDDVCPKCDHHMRIGARRRLAIFLDKEGREEILTHIEPVDRLKFRDKKRYRDRISAAQKSTGEKDALVAMRGTLQGMPVVCVAFEFAFHGGSMGYAVGEKFTQAAQLALRESIPLVCFSASGGARMQEALISLMQMAKTSAVIERMKLARVPYISVMTDPIYGGVSASLALLGDINVAEPDARAGFAGPNIIEQTIRQKLPKGFQRSEFLLDHGAIDMIVHRNDMRDTLARLLAKFTGQEPVVQDVDESDESDEASSSAQAEEPVEFSPDTRMTESALAAWLVRLEALYPQPIKLGLERVAEVANTLSLLPVSVPVVTVAGTNGKGSVVATVEALLQTAGVSAGVYTSPHLLRFNERIRINGEEATDREIVAALEAVEAARGEVALTYFEFTTLAALLLFKTHAVQVVVLEVGLGGRLDAVNIVDPTVAVITSIALDHQEWLGDNLDQIAQEKAGILRAGRPAVIAATEPPGLRAAVEARGARALWLQADFGFEPAGAQWRGWLQTSAGDRRQLPTLENPALLPANLCAALQVLELLGLPASDAALETVVPAVQPPGRRQRLNLADLELILDVAHNPAAVGKLVEFIDISPCNGKTIALFSAMADKDIQAIIDATGERFAAWFLADQPDNPRAAPAATIAALLREAGQGMISVSKNLRQALARARSIMAPGDRLVVFGSFHTVAAALRWLAREQGKG